MKYICQRIVRIYSIVSGYRTKGRLRAHGASESLAVSCSKLLVHRIATIRADEGARAPRRADAWDMGRGVWGAMCPRTRHDSGQAHLGDGSPMFPLSLSMLDNPLAAGAATGTRQAQARG